MGIGSRRGRAAAASCSTTAVSAAIAGQASPAPIRRASERAAASDSGLSMKSQTAFSIACDVVEWDELPCACGEHVLREEVRRGDRSAPSGDGKGQRP